MCNSLMALGMKFFRCGLCFSKSVWRDLLSINVKPTVTSPVFINIAMLAVSRRGISRLPLMISLGSIPQHIIILPGRRQPHAACLQIDKRKVNAKQAVMLCFQHNVIGSQCPLHSHHIFGMILALNKQTKK